MTKAQIDQAHRLVAELNMYAKGMDYYGNPKPGAAMRNAAALLQQMVEEYEAKELELMRVVQSAANRDAQPRLPLETPDG
jgi:hypothetical protein